MDTTRYYANRVKRLIWQLLAVGVIMIFIGGALNMLASVPNGWRMPVAVDRSHVLFTLGEPMIAGKVFEAESDFQNSSLAQPMKAGMHFLLFADRIPHSRDFVAKGPVPTALKGAAELLHVALFDEGTASIGDLVIWAGIAVGFIPLLLLSPCILLGLMRRAFGSA